MSTKEAIAYAGSATAAAGFFAWFILSGMMSDITANAEEVTRLRMAQAQHEVRQQYIMDSLNDLKRAQGVPVRPLPPQPTAVPDPERRPPAWPGVEALR